MHRRIAFVTGMMCMAAFASAQHQPDVFEMPRWYAQYTRLQARVQDSFKTKQYEIAERACVQAISMAPHIGSNYYNYACALAQQEKMADALEQLEKAIDSGFTDADHIASDNDLKNLRDEDRFKELIEKARATIAKPDPWLRTVEPGVVKDGVVTIESENTEWDATHGVFRTHFKAPDDSLKKEPVILKHGEVGQVLRSWYMKGTVAGNVGDFYENHDRDHSNMRFGEFPQLTRIEFGERARGGYLTSGLQNRFFFNTVTIGNSSTAMTSGAYWRSQPRLAYTDPRSITILYSQYVSNHMYFYPEHRDHDPGHNGKAVAGARDAGNGGYGDVYPANTPYVLISQGSSGSDRSFLDQITCILAAFRPETKKRLIENGLLMPTVQMIFRMSLRTVETGEDYLTGNAHPTVFWKNDVNVMRSIRMAHAMKPEEVPPMIQLKVMEEDHPVAGRDFFAASKDEKVFDTPCAIARVMRSTKRVRRMVVSAEKSHDVNKRDLTWRWVVLRGDAKTISIEPLNDSKSIAVISVPWHERRPVRPGSDMASNRVDIGVFAHNGKYFSAPGFVTFYSLDNEHREYDDEGRIKSVRYDGTNYVDPRIALSKMWRDEYQYDGKGQLIGWSRHRAKQPVQQFMHDGAVVTMSDEQGRGIEAMTVRYVPKGRSGGAPLLMQIRGNQRVIYRYDGDDAKVGKEVKRHIVEAEKKE